MTLRRALLASAAVLAVAAGCSAPPPPPPPANVLVGEWSAEFHAGSRALRWLPGRVAAGRITFRPDPRLTMPSDELRGLVQGTHAVAFRPMLGPSAADERTAAGFVEQDGVVVVVLGGSGDRGAVGGRGRLVGDEIQGRWEREYLGDVPGGWFVLHRVTNGGAAVR